LDITLSNKMIWINNQPEEMMYTHKWISGLNYSCGCPQEGEGQCRDLHMMTEMDTSCTKAEDLFSVTGAVKSEGSIAKADLKGSFELVGPMETIWNHGQIRINGSSEQDTKRNNLVSSVQYEHNYPDNFVLQLLDLEYFRKYYTFFQLSETDLESGKTTVYFEIVSNSTRDIKGIMDFEILESGKIEASGNTTTYDQILRLRDREFLFRYDVNDQDKTLLLVEVAVKLREENEQLKLDINSKNSFDNPSSFNVTLTR